jgi:hypothetical protein
MYDVGEIVIAEHNKHDIVSIVRGEILSKTFPRKGSVRYSLRFFLDTFQYTAFFDEENIIGFANEPRQK